MRTRLTMPSRRGISQTGASRSSVKAEKASDAAGVTGATGAAVANPSDVTSNGSSLSEGMSASYIKSSGRRAEDDPSENLVAEPRSMLATVFVELDRQNLDPQKYLKILNIIVDALDGA